jgi:repressor LexA
MSQIVTLELPDHVYQAAQRTSLVSGCLLQDCLVNALESWVALLDEQHLQPGIGPEEPTTEPRGPGYTKKQGQYLAFIHHYTKLHGQPPAESDMQHYFQVTSPSVHQMVVRLGQRGFISRVPGQPRSIRVLLPPAELPPLE